MSGWAHGWSGLLLAYAAVEAPMMVSWARRSAPMRQALRALAIGLPLVGAAGIGNAAISPLLRALGVGSGSFLQLLAGVGVTVAVGFAGARVLARPPKEKSVRQRGAIVHEERSRGRPQPPTFRACREERDGTVPEGAVTIAGVRVPACDETKHFKVVGTTGTGKSTAICEMLRGALGRSDRAIIADPDGGYCARFHDAARGDIVLNPFDSRSRKWDLFGEIDDSYDVDQLARSLLPDHGGADRSWVAYARTFFSAVARRLHEAGVRDVAELYRLMVVAGADELRVLLEGTPAQPFLDPQNARMFDSVRSVASSAIGPLEYITRQSSASFSVRQWVRGYDPGDVVSGPDRTAPGGVLFFPYRAGQIAALRSTISAWMRLAIFEAMNQPEGDRHLWFVVDELDALGQIDGLKDALARLRKFGGRCVLGFQSISQVSSTYGREEAHTIIENCGNSLLLRCSGSDQGGTAAFASRLIGQREVLRTSVSRSRRPTELSSSVTHSEQLVTETAVMDSQIEQLPDLEGYLKLASGPGWQRVRLPADGAASDDSGRADIRRSRRPVRQAMTASAARATRSPRDEHAVSGGSVELD